MFILVSLKAYLCDPIEVATAARGVTGAPSVRVAISPQTADISRVTDTGVETWTRHVDPNGHGSYTDSTLAEAAAEAGAVGTLINHSEKRLKLADIDGFVQAAERTDLEACIYANNPTQIGVVSALGPDSVAVEPPGLIGGDVSVATTDPDIITDAVNTAANVDEDVEVYYGVDISTGDDVVIVEELGVSGILLTSDIAKADDPHATFGDLVSGL